MSPSLRRSKFVLVVAAVLLWGCSSSRPTPSPTQVPGPASPTASLAASAAAPAAVPAPSPFATEAPIELSITDGGGDLHVDPLLNTVVVTVSDRVRVRSEPRVSADSIKYEPVLPLRTELLVLDGPVSASGYTWYQVAPVSFAGLDGPGYGWVAWASTDGEQWIATCPPRPDATTLRSMVGRLGLACYGDHEITFTARLAHGEGLVCHNDLAPLPWWVEPGWLDDCGSFKVFLSPLEGEPNDDFWVKLGPAIDRETLPPDYDSGTLIWTAVEVTGQYDHPEARTCRGKSVPDGDQPPEPDAVVAICRSQFVVTSISFPPPFPTPPVALVSGDQRRIGVTECGWHPGDNCSGTTVHALGVESIVRIPIGGMLRFELPIGCSFAQWSLGWVTQREHERWRGEWPDTFKVVEAGENSDGHDVLALAAPPAGDWSVSLRWGADCAESDGPASYGWFRDRFRVVVGD